MNLPGKQYARRKDETMRIKDYSNVELLSALIAASFNVVKHDTKTASSRLDKLEEEMAKRLGITEDELNEMRARL